MMSKAEVAGLLLLGAAMIGSLLWLFPLFWEAAAAWGRVRIY